MTEVEQLLTNWENVKSKINYDEVTYDFWYNLVEQCAKHIDKKGFTRTQIGETEVLDKELEEMVKVPVYHDQSNEYTKFCRDVPPKLFTKIVGDLSQKGIYVIVPADAEYKQTNKRPEDYRYRNNNTPVTIKQ